jgi:hypothetical protein
VVLPHKPCPNLLPSNSVYSAAHQTVYPAAHQLFSQLINCLASSSTVYPAAHQLFSQLINCLASSSTVYQVIKCYPCLSSSYTVHVYHFDCSYINVNVICMYMKARMHCKMKSGLKPRILAKRQGFSGKDLGRILGLLAKVNPPKTPGSWPRECPQDPKILEPLGQDCWPKIPRLRCKILAKMFPLDKHG